MSTTNKTISSGIGLGSAIAVTISWSLHQSILSAILHGIFSWFYVLYYAITRSAAVVVIGICVLLGLSACDDEYTPPERVYSPAPVHKKIIMKEAPVEQRMGFDFFANEPLRQKSVTIYYLVAEDGMVVEVGLTDYAKTKIGDEYSSYGWKTK